jgi:hypothetical protein
MRVFRFTAVVCVVLLLLAESLSANAFVRGAYYRLGDDDPGATSGGLGNDPTKDSFSDKLDLTRFGTPRYSADVPPNGPIPNKLSMVFANNEPHNPFAYYGRSTALDMSQQGYALEAWVKSTPPPSEPDGSEIIAYNGNPQLDGFGFMRDDDFGNFEFRSVNFGVILGPATDGHWHHLGYVRTFNTADYYFDGKLVKESTNDPAPLTTTDGFWIGGRTFPTGAGDVFNGLIDEVRYQTFNPLAAGAFDPTNFLISVPEPGAASFCCIAAFVIARRRSQRS